MNNILNIDTMKLIFFFFSLITLSMGYMLYADLKELEEDSSMTIFSAEDNAEEAEQAQGMARIKLKDDGKSYNTDITINGKYTIKNAIVDTGCTITQLTYSDYINMRINGLLSDDDFIKKAISYNSEDEGNNRYIYKIKEMKVGDAVIRDTYCGFTLDNKASKIRLIGLNFLQNFKVKFDFQNKDMILEK